MTQKEFIKAVTADVNTKYEDGKKKLSEKDVSNVVGSFTKTVTDTIVKGEKVQLAGFGIFESTIRAARTGRSPQTGETIQIPEKKVPKFKASKTLKDALNSK